MASDLVASLRIWAIEDIVIGGETFRVPPHCAADWLELLLVDQVSLWSIVPGLLEPDATEAVEEAIFSGDLTREAWEELAWDLVSMAAGRPWWTTLMLLGNAKHAANVEYVKGELVLNGIDATRISLSAWLDAVYRIFTQHMKPEDRQKFDFLLARPPAGTKTDSNANRSAFAALLSSS